VLDYGIGNLRSAQKALEFVGVDAPLTADKALIADADAVVLPGVGSFGSCVEALDRAGLTETAIQAAGSGRPFLGICVGMQMLFEASEESPGVSGLGVLDGVVQRLPDGQRRPQMQWNRLEVTAEDPAPHVAALEGSWMYFVHSYAAELGPSTVAVCDYGGPTTSVVRSGALLATQFHPEKSGADGLGMLARFAESLESR